MSAKEEYTAARVALADLRINFHRATLRNDHAIARAYERQMEDLERRMQSIVRRWMEEDLRHSSKLDNI